MYWKLVIYRKRKIFWRLKYQKNLQKITKILDCYDTHLAGQYFIAPALDCMPCLQAQGTRDCNKGFCHDNFILLYAGK